MGSLYVGAPNAPATSGVLCRLIVDDNCLVQMEDNVSRGAVVMEGVGSKVTTNYTGTSNAMYNGTDIAQWRLIGRPKCWCRYYKGDGRQCHGNADGVGQGLGKNKWVFTYDTEIYRAAYNLTTANFPGGQDWGNTTVEDVDPGATAAIKKVLLICADTAHDGQGLGSKKRVLTNDTPPFRSVALGGYYNTTAVPQDCPPGSP
jgi:hypothetical protein